MSPVKELMGHKSLRMTERYSHLSPNHKRRAVETLSRRLEGKVVTNWSQDDKIEESVGLSFLDNTAINKGLQ